MTADPFDIIVIGGGHAGVEAAWVAANAGARTALVTLDPARIGVMSCNPAIGGLAKGQMVREIDALGGIMGLATDATGIMFKMLNMSKGPAVRSPRAQCDKHAYARFVRESIESHPGITVIAGACEQLIVEQGDGRSRISGVVITSGRRLRADAVVLTTGTFMRGLMHTGEQRTAGGRAGEAPATGISAELARLGFELGRLKTGTPPRLRRSTIDWESLQLDAGDSRPTPFSDMTPPDAFPVLAQVACRITHTCAQTHEHIRDNLHRAPMFSGQIESAGPRYCPSIEDKVVRFASRDSHHVFLEPESHESDWIYCNGISTSLPTDVQDVIVRNLPGCAHAEILQYGYAVEYDMVRPHQIHPTCETKLIDGLFLAGQINGTSGYEEAGGQGVLAGLNATRRARGEAPITLGRDQAYIGVMMDDLVTKTPVEPYRMFTSRAEHRLLLRADNSADRLTPLAREWGIIDDERWHAYERRQQDLLRVDALVDDARIDGDFVRDRVRRPGYTADDLARDLALMPDVDVPRAALVTVHAERAYAGYIRRQHADVRRMADMEHRRLPDAMDYATIEGLRNEAAAALSRFRPDTLGQAGRLEGVNPADLTLLLVALRRRRRSATTGQAAFASGSSSDA
jgi:tRNA uridine 5-carboxymethylaminomethyl modification enzyme